MYQDEELLWWYHRSDNDRWYEGMCPYLTFTFSPFLQEIIALNDREVIVVDGKLVLTYKYETKEEMHTRVKVW